MYPFTDPVIKKIMNEEREEGMHQGVKQTLDNLVLKGIITKEIADEELTNAK